MSQQSATPPSNAGIDPRTILRISLAVFFLLPVRNLAAQAQPGIKKLAAAEAAALQQKLDPRLLPPGSGELEFQPDQAVAIAGPSPLRLMPVRYPVPNNTPAAPPHFQCGLFIVAEDRPTRFLPTFGIAWTEAESCDGLDAIGLDAASPDTTDAAPKNPDSAVPATPYPSGPPAYPAIVLIYQAYTTPQSFPEPVLLTWDPKSAAYRPDAAQSQWLAQQKDGRTIPGARRLLATRPH